MTNDTLKHIIRVGGVAAIGIAAAIGADMFWPEKDGNAVVDTTDGSTETSQAENA
jgi:actin-like ATPase involved in cell morphogenesis